MSCDMLKFLRLFEYLVCDGLFNCSSRNIIFVISTTSTFDIFFCSLPTIIFKYFTVKNYAQNFSQDICG